MKLNLAEDENPPRIEILPLIDVVFLLLVFFIYAIVNMEHVKALDVNLAQGSSADIVVEDPFVISIDKHNQVFIDVQRVNLDELKNHLESSRIKKSSPILINGDRKADLGEVLRLLEAIKDTGFDNIQFRRMREQ